MIQAARGCDACLGRIVGTTIIIMIVVYAIVQMGGPVSTRREAPERGDGVAAYQAAEAYLVEQGASTKNESLTPDYDRRNYITGGRNGYWTVYVKILHMDVIPYEFSGHRVDLKYEPDTDIYAVRNWDILYTHRPVSDSQ